MINKRDFIENKKHKMQKLETAKKENKVDAGIIPILDIINSCDEYYTSSSCFGRIVLLELPELGDKKNAKWLGKWHRKIQSDELLEAFTKAEKGMLWLLAQSPIIHVFSKDFKSADKLVKTAVSCGLKHSGFKTVDKNIIVELTSTERLDTPVGKDKVLFCNKDYVDFLVDIANDIFQKSNSKLMKFKTSLDNNTL